MKNALRKAWVNFRLGVLGASYVPRAIAAWATLAFFLAGMGLGVYVGVPELASGDWPSGVFVLVSTLILLPLYTYFALDAMAGMEQLYRADRLRRYHERNSR